MENQNDNTGTDQKELGVLWTVNQVAKYLSVTSSTVYHWLSEGRMIDPTQVVKLGHRVRIPRSEVMRIAGVIKSKLKGE